MSRKLVPRKCEPTPLENMFHDRSTRRPGVYRSEHAERLPNLLESALYPVRFCLTPRILATLNQLGREFGRKHSEKFLRYLQSVGGLLHVSDFSRTHDSFELGKQLVPRSTGSIFPFVAKCWANARLGRFFEHHLISENDVREGES